MARIRTIAGPSSVRVVVTGKLGAADMRRLEQACALALTNDLPDLIVDLKQVTSMDNVAAAHLRHFARRGAIISSEK